MSGGLFFSTSAQPVFHGVSPFPQVVLSYSPTPACSPFKDFHTGHGGGYATKLLQRQIQRLGYGFNSPILTNISVACTASYHGVGGTHGGLIKGRKHLFPNLKVALKSWVGLCGKASNIWLPSISENIPPIWTSWHIKVLIRTCLSFINMTFISFTSFIEEVSWFSF